MAPPIVILQEPLKTPFPFISLPMRGFPSLRDAGSFPMKVPECNQVYAHDTVALHLHEYPGKIWIKNKMYRLQPGDVTFSPPSRPSRYHLKESGAHLCIHFDPAKSGKSPLIPLPLHFHLGAQAVGTRERFWRIIDYYRQSEERKDSPAGCAASVCLQELILWLYLQSGKGTRVSRSSRAEEALVKLRNAMDSLLPRQVTVPELAMQSGLSADYVARLFSRHYGMTIPHYFLLRRIELARHLLISSDLPVKEIGGQVGIPDPHYFNKQFRRMTGFSPTTYRLGGKRK